MSHCRCLLAAIRTTKLRWITQMSSPDPHVLLTILQRQYFLDMIDVWEMCFAMCYHIVKQSYALYELLYSDLKISIHWTQVCPLDLKWYHMPETW